MPNFTKLKNVKQFGYVLLNEQLEHNIMSFFDWGVLQVGGFGNVVKPTLGAYDGPQDNLRWVETPNYNDGQVWEGFRQNWVWESGVPYAIQPIQASGVTVDGTFYHKSTVGPFAHHINFPLGRIVFDTAIPTTSNVEAEFAYKNVNFTTANVPWFRELMFNSMRSDRPDFNIQGSGNWGLLGHTRIQLPTVIIEAVPRRSFKGYQLGGGQIVDQDVLFHIFAEDSWMRNNLIDIITTQNDKTIVLFDRNNVLKNNAYPLDANGSIKSGALTYPDLVRSTGDGGFYWHKARFKNMTSQSVESPQPLFRAVVRGTVQVDQALI
jgi:hypothetical protein